MRDGLTALKLLALVGLLLILGGLLLLAAWLCQHVPFS
jgi:hypothetical protein